MLQIKNPGRRKGLCRPELLSRYGDAKHTYKTVPVTAKSYALGSVQPPDITRTCALASAELIAHHSRLKFGCFSGFNYQRLPQFPLQLLRHPPPPRTSLTTNNSNTAPIVALAIAEIMPEPRWRPSCGRSQSPMKAPTIPMRRSPMIPNPVPCTICPASHPATRPTNNMIRRLSPDMCIFISSSVIKPLSARLRAVSSHRSAIRLRQMERRESQPRLWLKYNEDGAGRPHCLAKMISASDLGSNHRYNCQGAGIHDQNFIADQDIIIAAILRGIFQDRNRQIITMNCSWNNRTDRG